MAAPSSPAGGARRRPSFFRVLRFDRTVRGSRNAVIYVAFKSEDLKRQEPCVFTVDRDSADVRSWLANLEDPIMRHPSAAKSYHCVFSLRRPDFEVTGEDNWRDVVRETLRSYELETGKRLTWIASSHHSNPQHPHCHVVIAAMYKSPDGRSHRLYLNKVEVQRIKDHLGRALEARGLTEDRLWSRPRAQPNRNMNGVLSWLESQIKAERRRMELEEERRLRRMLDDAEREAERDRGRDR